MNTARFFVNFLISNSVAAVLFLASAWPPVSTLVIKPTLAQNSAGSWKHYKNERFGYSFEYPAQLFFPEPPPANNDGLTFYSRDGQAKLIAYGANNIELQTPRVYRAEILEDMRGRASIDYKPMGKSWFVLSGYVDDKVYYQKVRFSCRGKIISAFALSYPARDKGLYDPIVERIEDSFKPARRC